MNSRDRVNLKLSRRGLLRALAFGAGTAAVMAACSPPVGPASSSPSGAQLPATLAPPTTSAATTAVAASSNQPRRGGTLRVGVLSEPPSMDGFLQLGVIRGQLRPVFDKLIDMDQKAVPQPGLATSWEMNQDFTQLKMNLRHNVQFHSGRELTSADIKWNLDRTHDPQAGNGNLPPLFAPLKDVQTPDASTVVLSFAQPWPAFFDILNFVNIVDPQSNPKAAPVGTGPFTFGEWASGDHLRVVQGKNYWQSGKPYVDDIVFQFIGDAQALVVQLESGTIDVADSVPTAAAARLQKDPKYQVVVSPNPSAIHILGVNVANAPLDQKQVRQALNFAIDRKRMVDTVLGGFGEARILPWPSTSIAYDQSLANTYAFDLAKAGTLLTAAGVSNLVTELTYPTNTPEYQRMAEIYQADLNKLGITLNLKPLEPAAWNNYVINTRGWGLSFAQAPPVNEHPGSVLGRVWTSPASNINSFRSDVWTDLAARVSAEGDPAKLKTLSVELDQYLLDQSWFIPITSSAPKLAASARVMGVTFDANDTPTYGNAWLTA